MPKVLPSLSNCPIPEARAFRRPRRGSRQQLRLVAGVALIAVSIALTACSVSAGDKSMSQSDVEKQSAIELSKVVGVPASQVPPIHCPSDLTAKVGTKMTCSIGEAPGKVYDMYVTVLKVTKSNNRVFFDVKVAKTPRP